MFKTRSAFNWTVRVLLPTASIALAPGALGQDSMSQSFIKGGGETFTLNLGGILNQFDTTLRRDSSQGGRGSDVNLENNGLKRNPSSFEASATWRFSSRNRIDVLYFEASRSGDHRLDSTLTIGDTDFPANSDLTTQLKNQFLVGDYRFSFVTTERIEVAGLLGVYGARLRYNASATGSGSGNTVSTSASATLPLPVIGATLDWYINPRWKVSGEVAGFKAHIDNVDGSALVAEVATEFMLVRNFGLGLAYMYTISERT